MTTYEIIESTPRTYLYVERSSSMDPADISRAMGEAFHAVAAFMQQNGIAFTGPALSAYYTFSPEKLDFRSGFFVADDDAGKAAGDIKADITPAGRVLFLTHVGPYAGLRQTYADMMTWMEEQKLEHGAPTWEVYVDDPDSTPAEKLRTEIFVTLA